MAKIKEWRGQTTGVLLGYVLLDVYNRPLNERFVHSNEPKVYNSKSEAASAALSRELQQEAADWESCASKSERGEAAYQLALLQERMKRPSFPHAARQDALRRLAELHTKLRTLLRSSA